MALTGRDRYLAALSGGRVDRPPAWIMRQAGRYLPEYRELRSRHAFLECVHDPALAAEITLQPMRRFPLDAAIVFSDILIALEAAGIPVDFEAGRGPRIEPRLADPAFRWRDVDAARDFAYLAETLERVRAGLGGERALLGFAGAPFTLACYALDGGSQDDFRVTRTLLYSDPARLDRILARFADVVADLLLLQLRAGADAVQLFDTWGGLLSAADWSARSAPHVRRVIDRVHGAGGRVVLFLKDGAHLVEAALACGPDALGCDWRVDMAAASRAAAGRAALQGNLDPLALFAPADEVRRRVRSIHEDVGGRTGHVFNLGHGILPATPISGVEAFLEAVASLEPLP